jgi:hypothetical protein
MPLPWSAYQTSQAGFFDARNQVTVCHLVLSTKRVRPPLPLPASMASLPLTICEISSRGWRCQRVGHSSASPYFMRVGDRLSSRPEARGRRIGVWAIGPAWRRWASS